VNIDGGIGRDPGPSVASLDNRTSIPNHKENRNIQNIRLESSWEKKMLQRVALPPQCQDEISIIKTTTPSSKWGDVSRRILRRWS
jgi:hypothetical protein